MEKSVVKVELKEPRFFKEGYAYIGQDEQWHINQDAPEWAKQEFEQFFKQISGEPDEQGIATHY